MHSSVKLRNSSLQNREESSHPIPHPGSTIKPDSVASKFPFARIIPFNLCESACQRNIYSPQAQKANLTIQPENQPKWKSHPCAPPSERESAQHRRLKGILFGSHLKRIMLITATFIAHQPFRLYNCGIIQCGYICLNARNVYKTSKILFACKLIAICGISLRILFLIGITTLLFAY